MSSELKACPWCNGHADIGEDECVHDVVFAFCTRCAAQGPFDPDRDREEAIAAWNTRTNPDGLREALEAVTAIADEYTDDQPPQTKARQIVKRVRATLAAMRP